MRQLVEEHGVGRGSVSCVSKERGTKQSSEFLDLKSTDFIVR